MIEKLGWRHLFGKYYWYPGQFKWWEREYGFGYHEDGYGYHYECVYCCKWGKVMKFSWRIQDYD